MSLCSGKSTVGKMLARTLEYPFLDADQIAEAYAGQSIAQIFEAEGEEGFREMESQVLQVPSLLFPPSFIGCSLDRSYLAGFIMY